MNGNSGTPGPTPPPPNQGGSPRPEPGDERESASPVGDMFEEGETDVGPHPSLIDLENWEASELMNASPEDTEGTSTEEAGASDQDAVPDE